MNQRPGATDELVVDWGATAATLGVRVLDNQGATTIARTTGFVEYPAGSGVYYLASFTFPDVRGTYTLLYDDDGGIAALGHVSTEGLLITSSAPEAPTGDTYGTTDELFLRLKIRQPTPDQEARGEQVLLMATGEINSEIDLAVGVDLEPWQLALAAEVNLKRAVELWAESPFGLIGLDQEFVTHTARNSWERYAHMLAPLKDQWGLA
jgi:hypothetical protein